jgi:phage terminase large subunit
MESKKKLVFDPNRLCYQMIKFYQENYLNLDEKLREQLIICNEGGARSSKTFDAFHFLFWLCDLPQSRRSPLQIFVYRKTLKSCREKTYLSDFVTCMKLIGIYDSANARDESGSPSYNLFGSIIKFRGLDNDEELGMSDVVFFNEALDNDDQRLVDKMLMRCKKLGIFDWNPKLTYHFLFDYDGRKNCLFTKTTFWNNKHLDNVIRQNLISKCPWSFRDFDMNTFLWRVPKEERSINEENAKNKTINEHDWLVYGEGMRCPEEGAVFKNITWIPSFPTSSLDEVRFGLDFGYTSDPSVLVKVGRSGLDLYIEYLTYEPCDSPDSLYAIVEPILDEEVYKRKQEAGTLDHEPVIVHCDSSDKYRDAEFVAALNETRYVYSRDFEFIKTSKISIVLGISAMKRFNIHVVDSVVGNKRPSIMEFENYGYQIVEGRQTNIPIDKLNHGIDATRYVVVDNWLYLVRELVEEKA